MLLALAIAATEPKATVAVTAEAVTTRLIAILFRTMNLASPHPPKVVNSTNQLNHGSYTARIQLTSEKQKVTQLTND